MVKKGGKLPSALVLAVCAMLTPPAARVQAQTPNGNQAVKAAILSPSRSADSLGETVYEVRKQGDQEQPAVAGAFTPPVALKQNDPFPEYPESMRRKKQDRAVVVEGIVAQDGRFIDLKVSKTTDPAFNKNATKAAGKYTFQPATLNGKPVACLVRVEMTFNIYR